jgi:hypothetical protein
MSAEAFMARHNAGTIEDQLDHMTGYQAAGASHSMLAIPDVHLDGSIEAFGEVIEGMHHP